MFILDCGFWELGLGSVGVGFGVALAGGCICSWRSFLTLSQGEAVFLRRSMRLRNGLVGWFEAFLIGVMMITIVVKMLR